MVTRMTVVNDPIGDLINRVKNAQAVGHESVSAPYSKLKHAIAEKLVERGFIAGVEVKGKEPKEKVLVLTLAYRPDGSPKISHVERVSKPGRRLYTNTAELKPVQHGKGALIVSTSKGIMTDAQARKEQVGGEMLFKIW